MELPSKDSLYEEKILKCSSGVEAICEIIRLIAAHFKPDRSQLYSIYPRPTVLFRGIDGIYDDAIHHKEYVQPINSSLSVRIKKSYGKGSGEDESYAKANYLNCLLKIIADARKNCPNKYKGMCDLHILADIQHNGGATCLVDFSKSFLLPLWFACKRSEYKGNATYGVLYCYNYMHDLIVKNNLSIVHSEEENKSIQELVCGTYTIVDYCSDSYNRFRLWEPLAINNRITRQDSVFLFGIEKFKPDNHDILAIIIPDNLKDSIRQFLAEYLNISTATVFNDDQGIARANDKFTPFEDREECFNDRCYIEGFDCMIRGNYSEALELLIAYDINKKSENTPTPRKMELCYSLAVCYKNLASTSEYSAIYYRNAIDSFKGVIELAAKAFKAKEVTEMYYLRKTLRAYNEVIELYYETRDYQSGVMICDEAQNFIESYTNDSNMTLGIDLNVKYLSITQCELCFLKLLELVCTNKKKDISSSARDLLKKTFLLLEGKNGLNKFDTIFIETIRWFVSLLNNILNIDTTNFKRVTKPEYNQIKKEARKSIEFETAHYMEWAFTSIVNEIENCEVIDYQIKIQMLDAISELVSIRDMYDAQSRIVLNEQ